MLRRRGDGDRGSDAGATGGEVNGGHKSTRSEESSTHAHSKRGWCSWFVHLIRWPLLLLAVPPLVNYGSLQNERGALLPPDAVMYDAGHGQNLMVRCRGTGAPTVILDSPAGTSSDVWSLVQAELAKTTRACVYDRAGLGFSDRPKTPVRFPGDEPALKPQSRKSQPFTVERMAEDFKRLFTEVSSQPTPFILVGSDLGSLVGRFYAHLYDDQVAGLYLVDPLTSALFSRQVWLHHWNRTLAAYQERQLMAALGLSRLSYVAGVRQPPDFWSAFPEENTTRRQMHLDCHPRHIRSGADEASGVPESLKQITVLSTVKPFPRSLQVTVLYRQAYDSAASEEVNRVWRLAREELSASLKVPEKQLRIIDTPSQDVPQSHTGDTAKRLVDLLRAQVKSHRQGRTTQAA